MKTKPSTLFIIVIMVILLAYLYSMYKVIIFNHSNTSIQSITIDSKYAHKIATNVANNTTLQYNIFSPFDKKIHIVIKQPDNIKSITFTLEGLLPLEQQNQLEILPDGSIRHGALGLKRQQSTY